MESFLSGFGSKIAEKWLTVLVLPGLLFAGATLIAWALPQDHALDLGVLADRTTAANAWLDKGGASVVLLAVALTMLWASAAALAARGGGFLVHRMWLRRWTGPVSRHLVQRRQDDWTAADDALADLFADDETDLPARRNELAAVRNGIALAFPARPTWTADRARSVDVRIWHAYGLDLASVWPRLWLVVPEETRAEIRAARDSFGQAGDLLGWSLLYLAVTPFWWPSAVVGMATALTGWYRTRASLATYADLVEATVDLRARALAVELALLPPDDPFTRETGLRITRLLRKGT
ncbi:hypothetical protein [Streptomyces sp. NPDC006335]|uniref:hypothetical protein n=1 Tax=Streptomyces sp. NPDC006335 TaxID=3156895 RepID=UPI0033BABCA8